MKRRTFIASLAAPLAWPPSTPAQRQPKPVVGFLSSATPELYQFNVAAFRAGLREQGHVEGRTVTIEYRWARGDYDRMPALAALPVTVRASARCIGWRASTWAGF